MFPTPSQLLVKLSDLIHEGNEPGFGQRVQLWPNGDDTSPVAIYAYRPARDYAIRFQTGDGLTSLPVMSFRRYWQLDNLAMDRTSDWLEIVRQRKSLIISKKRK